ncbi:mitochondrial precursor, putative [Ichthyophthirius multifiliis]|uniref:Mitochondrial, putative n=1 Tax=Ichthyophthirius multifiliis TaxID=5932 RepID=G0R0S8_ICHMU|nr:mitochondrial precursor, putative [Ichthyophthirius multifiliis]EGR28923.1 mitochondrial precursor, putative [Ichthyophthirius multifiliis]|eukprot:XP_004030159.1 mitochondrial precursor, putative [Ichthyophthirius multifiliis]
MQNSTPVFLWIDLEMTGLDLHVRNDQIIELAVVLTDSHLENIIKGPEIVINAPNTLLDTMDEWNSKHHKESGLYEQSLNSKISLQQAEEQVLQFLKSNNVVQRQAYITGNSVHQDYRFLDKQMPKLIEFLHYRIIDVSTIKTLAQKWNPGLLADAPVKKNQHRALDDILESIEELKYYKSSFFKIV